MSNPIDRVSDTGVHRLPERQQGGSRDAAESSKQAAGGVRGTDLLDLTGKAQELKALEKDLAREPTFDSQRVEALRQQLADGSYQVNPERIAEKLLAIEQRLP